MHFRLESGIFQYRNETSFVWAYNSETDNVLINVTLRCVRVVVVAVEKE
jgi:hypothetical protein